MRFLLFVVVVVAITATISMMANKSFYLPPLPIQEECDVLSS